MFTLRVSPDWATQIAAIRNEVSEDTNLIRFDNNFYRICRDDPGSFFVKVLPFNGQRDKGIELRFLLNNFYITHVGSRPFERYASNIDLSLPSAHTLDNFIYDLSSNQKIRSFEIQSLIVFCVAESLRYDYIATTVGHMISATLTNLKGVPGYLTMSKLFPLVHAWGQTSDAILSSLSPQAKSIVLRSRNVLPSSESQFWERVDLSKIPQSLQGHARIIKVLKRPG
ncbi:hypothetical protein [Nitrosomonas communis]|uniref:Uncharacterized protein n=1 Tax=Nitrosomonas communis TaxID=44574 RepID=A0A1H2V436_9PROT|nr:hypothetical protein [Nitrosomonas communis]SDW63065.1 hypothetical protein SAMN05421882_101944 [Nitrosomonas communis]